MQEKLFFLFVTINYKKNEEKQIDELNFELKKHKYQISWYYLVEEKRNNKHHHIILAIKTILEYNDQFKINILNELKENISWDIMITKLNSFEIIKQKFVYILKDSFIFENNNLSRHVLIYEYFLYEKNIDFFKYLNNFIITESINNNIENIYDYGSINNIKSFENSKESTYNLIKLFFIIKKFKYKNEFILKKIENSSNSFIQFNKIKWFKENFLEIYSTLIIYFPLNLNGVFIDQLLIKNKILNEDIELMLKNMPQNQNLRYCFDIIEFLDGYYFFKLNKFVTKQFLKENNIKIDEKILLLKYYNYKYNRKKNPEIWKKTVLNAINNDLNKFELICAYLANTVIKNNEVFEKKKVLYIWGNSSTGKTTIIARPLWRYFGEDNIGIISGSKNFALENLVNKELAILDEYKFIKQRRETDLKLFEGQTIIEDAKYKEQQKIKDINLIVLSNFAINPKENVPNEFLKHTDEALYNRTQQIEFVYNNELNNKNNITNNIIKKIEKEDPYILIFCNRIYHKIYIKNKAKTKNNLLKNILKKKNIVEEIKTTKKVE